MGNIYVISDTHFGHQNIIALENRPFQDLDDMDTTMIKNWNAVVNKDDIVYHLGDVSFYGKEKTMQIMKQLNGNKILIMGNHDKARSAKWWQEVGFKNVYEHPTVLNEFFILSHEPPMYFNNNTPYGYIYGHVHGTKLYPTTAEHSACVCVERHDYRPVNLNDLIQKMKGDTI